MNRLAITRIQRNHQDHIAYIMLDEHREFVDFQLSEPEGKSILNRIYICRVEEIVPNIHAAFVRISKDQRCFLPLEDMNTPLFTKKQSQKKALCIGDELLVQVLKDAVKTKAPVVTTKLTLQGKCCVLTTENTMLSVSKKLGEKRDFYRKLLEEAVSGSEDGSFGMIIRTSAASYSNEAVRDDILNLIRQYQSLRRIAVYREAYSMLYEDSPFYIECLKSTDLSRIDCITTDCRDIYEQILHSYPPAASRLSLYQDEKLRLCTLYHIEGNIDQLIAPRVWLKSGANIIIEQLETLTVIDVNTGKNQSGKKSAFLAVNKEAAAEIARQLRLRNISGMILIDFINLTSEEEEQDFLTFLRGELKKDRIPCNFIDITKLGIVEVTRKKVHKSLREILSGN